MQVKVYNENIYPYKENFKDEMIEIEPGGFITMDEKKAITFLGTYAVCKKTPQGQPDPRYFKKLKIVHGEIASKPVEKLICQFDGKEFDSQKELDKWIDENHLEKLTDVKVADERRKKNK